MRSYHFRCCWAGWPRGVLAAVFLAALIGSFGVLLGHAVASEQRVVLQEGWNAVFLELDPVDPDPDAIFASLPIEQCTLWLPSKAKVDSLTDPAALPDKPSEWLVWHPAGHPAAFLNTLKQVQGRRALLIKASSPATLIISGTHIFERHSWIAPSFNLKGFDVDPNAPPTFARFFDASRAHEDLKIYKLVENTWRKVQPQETMRRGVAYWVWCKEGSDFQGPVDLSLSGARITLTRSNPTSSVRVHKNGTLPVYLKTTLSDGLPLEVKTESPQVALRETPVTWTIQLREPFTVSTGHLIFSGGGVRMQVPVMIP